MHSKYDENIKSNTPLLYFLHCAIGLLVCLALSLFSSALIYSERIDISMSDTLFRISAFIGATLASVLSCKKFKRNLLTATIQALLSLGTCYLIGLVLYSRLLPSWNNVSLTFIYFAGAITGAVFVAVFKRR